MVDYTEGHYKDKRYFSSTRNYTLALLDAFNGIHMWTETEGDTQKEYTIPISFGNYEKSHALQDIDETQITKGNFNFVPRLVLTFEGISKIPERQTNKFHKLTKKVYDHEKGKPALDVAYNSVAYDFHFTLLLQTRGLTIASQVTEEILAKFNPTLNLLIQEFPIFDHKTETQIQISDPAFEIMDEFEETQVNIINVTFDINVRGNIYNQIELSGPIETVKLYTNIWDQAEVANAKLSSYYRYDVDPNNGKVFRQTDRTFDASLVNGEGVDYVNQEDTLKARSDFVPPEYVSTYEDNLTINYQNGNEFDDKFPDWEEEVEASGSRGPMEEFKDYTDIR